MRCRILYTLMFVLFLGYSNAIALSSVMAVNGLDATYDPVYGSPNVDAATKEKVLKTNGREKIVNQKWKIDTSRFPRKFEECMKAVCLNKGDTIFIEADSDFKGGEDQKLTLKVDRGSNGAYDHEFSSINSHVRMSSSSNSHVEYIWMKFIDRTKDNDPQCREISLKSVKLKGFIIGENCPEALRFLHGFLLPEERNEICKKENLIHWVVDDASGCGELDSGSVSTEELTDSVDNTRAIFLSPPEPGQGTASGTQ